MNRLLNKSAALSSRNSRLLWALILLSLGVFIRGVAKAPDRAWPAFLMAFLYLVALGLGASLFIAIHYASNARWATAIRRVPEAMVSSLALAVLPLLAILAWGLPHIYPWARPGFIDADAVLRLKATWFNVGFFRARAFLCLGAWLLLMTTIVRHSRRQDADGPVGHRTANIRLSMVFLGVFALSFPLASMDWIMSLEPRWFSTILGIYTFAGVFQTGLAMLVIVLLFLHRQGFFPHLRPEHLHDLGKLVFAFSNFWAYMWFSQYMLIWYADQKDEITYYMHRQGMWWILMLTLVVMKFAIPFFALLSQPAKRSKRVLGAVCLVILVGHWLDLAVMILPMTSGAVPKFGALEILLPLGAIAAFLLVFFKVFAAHPPLPTQEVGLQESLHYH